MKIIITGGSGLLGKELIPVLLAHQHEVIILTRSAHLFGLPEGVTAVQWDGRSAEGWGHLVEDCDALINLAGENIGDGAWTEERKRRILDSRKRAGEAVSQAVVQAKQKPAVVVQASAVGCYGTPDDRILDESSPFGSDYLSQICVDWENSTASVEALGVRRIIIRTGLVLTRQGGVLEKLKLPIKLFAGGPLGSGKQWYSWIHIADQIAAMVFLLEHPQAQGIYNLTAPEPVMMDQFGRLMAGVLHRPYWAPVPGFALKALLGEMSILVLKGQRVLPRRLQALGFGFKFSQLRPALEDLLR